MLPKLLAAVATTIWFACLVFADPDQHRSPLILPQETTDLPLDIRGAPEGTPVRDFTAAVYETAARQWDPALKKPWAENLATAQRQAVAASAQGADILVLAEYGISGGIPHDEVPKFGMELPPLDDLAVPCADKSDLPEVLVTLSCMAQQNSIYLVVNAIEKEPCNAIEGGPCASRDALFYNTNLVFDRNGSLIQKYRKINLFDEESIPLTPGEPRLAAFRTDFGVTFGLMICFDVLFHAPGVEMWRRGIDHFTFPTYWHDELPSLTALQMHTAWARSLDVTLLAAGLHSIKSASIGSGIYTGAGVINHTYNYRTNKGKLVVSKLPAQNSLHTLSRPITDKSPVETPQEDITKYLTDDYYPLKHYNISYYSSALLTGDKQEVCYEDFCCTITVTQPTGSNPSRENICSLEPTPTHRLLAYKGHRNTIDSFAVEICTVVLCADSSLESCNKFPAASSKDIPPFYLSGAFSETSYVYPSVILQHMQVSNDWDYDRSGRSLSVPDTHGLMTAQLFGRNYVEDAQ